MKHIFFVMLVIMSLALVAAGPPPGAVEKTSTAFYATETCKITNQGEPINRDGYTFYKGQIQTCELKSTDGQIAGTEVIKIESGKALDAPHSVVGHMHLKTAMHDWVGYRWGELAKDGTIKWINGQALTPETGSYVRHFAWFRYDPGHVNGWYDEMGMK